MRKPLQFRPLQSFVIQLTCKCCTRSQEFGASNEPQAVKQALLAGWVRNGEQFVCPKCPNADRRPLQRGDRLTIASTYVVNPDAPKDLTVPREMLSDQLREGDIVTFGSEGKPDTGYLENGIAFAIPTNQRFRVVAEKGGDPLLTERIAVNG